MFAHLYLIKKYSLLLGEQALP